MLGRQYRRLFLPIRPAALHTAAQDGERFGAVGIGEQVQRQAQYGASVLAAAVKFKLGVRAAEHPSAADTHAAQRAPKGEIRPAVA